MQTMMTLKTTLALGAAGSSLLTLAGAASAQTTSGDPTLTAAFSTVANPARTNYTTTAQGIGFDANNGNGKLTSSNTQATAQSLYEGFVFDSSAAGTFNTLASGTTVQLQVFAANGNVNQGPLGTLPFDLYASLYAYSPSAAGTVPAIGPNLFGAEQKVVIGQINGGYFSNDFTLAAPLVAGQSYVIGFTTLNGDTQDFAQIGTNTIASNGLSSADATFDNQKYATDVNDQGNPIGKPTGLALSGNNTMSFSLLAAAPAAVPEASSVVSMGLLLALSVGFVAFKRRRAVAN